jgi:hypothetical protein
MVHVIYHLLLPAPKSDFFVGTKVQCPVYKQDRKHEVKRGHIPSGLLKQEKHDVYLHRRLAILAVIQFIAILKMMTILHAMAVKA